MASPTVAHHTGNATGAAATSVSANWPTATAVGARLFAVVSFEANGQSNVPITPADPTNWKLKSPPGRIVRQATGVDELVVAVYEMVNAPSRSGAETFNLGAAVFATIDLIEVAGADTVAANALSPVTFQGSGLSISLSNPGSPTVDSLAILVAVNGNPASTQSPSAGWSLLDDLAPGSTGSDRERTDVYTKAVAAGAAVGAATVTISGATNRNLAAIEIIVPSPSAVVATDVSVVQSVALVPDTAGTAFDIAWDAATTAGNRLMLIVGENDNLVDTTVGVPVAWGSPINPPNVIKRPSTNPNCSLRVYEIRSASSRSGNEHITFDQSVFPYIELIEISGDDPATAASASAKSTGTGSGTAADTGLTPSTSFGDGMALAAVIATNHNSLSPEATYGFAELDSGASGSSGGTLKISGGVYTKPISVAGGQQLVVDILGGISRAWCAVVLTIPALSQAGGGGGGGGSGGIGGSPFFPDLDDGRRHGAASIHYGSPITSLSIAQIMANKYDVIIGTYDDTGGQFNSFADDIVAIKPSIKMGFYSKSAQSSKSSTYFPHAYYAYTAGGANITTFNGNILVMQPDGTANFSDPRGFTSTSWKDWTGRDHADLMAHENARWPGIDPMNLVYGDSMGTSSFKGTQVSPTDGHTYTKNEWLSLVWSIGDFMKLRAPAGTLVCGNGLISGPAYSGAKGLMNHVDCGLAENWLRNNYASITSFFTEAQWLLSINQVIDVNVNFRKAIWVIINIANDAAGNPPAGWVTPTAVQMDRWHRYAYASYLLAQRGACLYEFVEDSTNVKHWQVDHPYWSLRMGAPLEYATTAEAQKHGGLYYRLFTNGVAIVNPTGSSATFTCDRDYVDPITGAAHATGSTVTLTTNTGLILTTTATGTPNAGAPGVVWNAPTSRFSDVATKIVSVTITDPDGFSTPTNLLANGVNQGAWTNAGGGVYTRAVTFVDGVDTTLSFDVTDLHTTPLTAHPSTVVRYTAPAPPPPPGDVQTGEDTPPPPPPLPSAIDLHFAQHLHDAMAPVNFDQEEGA